MEKIGDYWSEEQTREIVNLFKEFQDIFAWDYKDLKVLVAEMGKMKIDIKPDARPVKKMPYKLAHKYKEIIQKGDRQYAYSWNNLPHWPVGMGKPNGHPTEKAWHDKAMNLCWFSWIKQGYLNRSIPNSIHWWNHKRSRRTWMLLIYEWILKA